MAVRRSAARRKLQTHQGLWPINPAAGKMPEGWPGWPDGKKFALILTHDVEGHTGLTKCQELMQLEQERGFRSSFNLIPEGDEYVVPRNLRETLIHNGFEVGVHDLYHNGKLVWNRENFRQSAKHINRYLKDWNACGFRAGFMLRNLDWFHDLNIKYDASTFDTDPFEPQPDGANTIFPFWVPLPSRDSQTPENYNSPETDHRSRPPANSGYVELPYTLAQDSTLFLLFKQNSIDTWKRKLDWIAEHGGMVLLNSHPDYMNFNGGSPTAHDYPSAHYTELLDYVSKTYSGQYWQALPREVADFAAKNRLIKPQPSQKRICMVSHSAYESDNRIIRYAEALAQRGDSVDVLAVKRYPSQPDRETLRDVNVYRLQGRPDKNQRGKLAFLVPILKFWLRSAVFLARQHLGRRYDLVHVHNVPDFLVFSALIPRLTGAKVILDIHDILPEFYASKFHVSANSPWVRMLRAAEKASAAFAHHVIISNHLWIDLYTQRSVARCKCSIFVNQVNTDVFHRRPRTRTDDKLIVIFPGGLQWHQGLDIAINAFATVAKAISKAEFHIYGDGNMKDELVALAKQLGLAKKVLFFDPLPILKIAEVMGNADLGVVPKRADSFGNEAYSTKIMEFMAVGVPVVVSSTKIDRYYFNDSIVRFFESGNVAALATAMLEVLRDAEIRRALVARASEHVARNNWEIGKFDYLTLVDSLCGGKKPIEANEVNKEPQASKPARTCPEGASTRCADLSPISNPAPHANTNRTINSDNLIAEHHNW